MVGRSDGELVALVVSGDGPAFSELFKRHSYVAFRLAMRLCGNANDAEEILQDSFLQVHRKLDSYRGDAKFSTWLYRVVVNTALMHLRERRRHVADRLDEILPRFDERNVLARLDVDYARPARADELLEARQLAAEALKVLDDLPESFRAVFVLRDLEGLDTGEAADVLGIQDELVRQRLHRARLMVRARLDELVGGES